jgi:hypothetical protein
MTVPHSRTSLSAASCTLWKTFSRGYPFGARKARMGGGILDVFVPSSAGSRLSSLRRNLGRSKTRSPVPMPFKSKAQLRTCYKKKFEAEEKGKRANWDCDEFLRETPDPSCLPERVGMDSGKKCRNLRKEERVPSELQVGPRGGTYFYAGGVKVYVPRGTKQRKTSPSRP